MYCAECGTANQAGAETCEVCGSPLGPSTGGMNCHVCGAPVDEHDRFCRACGQSQSGADAGRFEPGPSFVDDSNLEANPAELPPWLREMTESSAQVKNGHVTNTPTSVAEHGDSLPPWLDSAGPTNGSSESFPASSQPSWSAPAQPAVESAESFSLISEDDLPEWLRALGDQEIETEEPVAHPLPTSQSPQALASTSAPTISRAWLSRSRDTAVETVDEVAADFEPLESGPTVAPKRRTAPQTDELTPFEMQEEEVAPAIVNEAQQIERPTSSRVRVLMLSIVIILVVILAYFAVSNLHLR